MLHLKLPEKSTCTESQKKPAIPSPCTGHALKPQKPWHPSFTPMWPLGRRSLDVIIIEDVFLPVVTQQVRQDLVLVPCVFGDVEAKASRGLDTTRGTGLVRRELNLRVLRIFCRVTVEMEVGSVVAFPEPQYDITRFKVHSRKVSGAASEIGSTLATAEEMVNVVSDWNEDVMRIEGHIYGKLTKSSDIDGKLTKSSDICGKLYI